MSAVVSANLSSIPGPLLSPSGRGYGIASMGRSEEQANLVLLLFCVLYIHAHWVGFQCHANVPAESIIALIAHSRCPNRVWRTKHYIALSQSYAVPASTLIFHRPRHERFLYRFQLQELASLEPRPRLTWTFPFSRCLPGARQP